MENNKSVLKTKHKQNECDSKINPDVSYIKEIVKILKDNDLAEIKYETKGIEIKIVAQPISQTVPNLPVLNNPPFGNFSQSVVAPQMGIQQPLSIPQLTSNQLEFETQKDKNCYINHPGAVKSPMVGTCYLSPEPGAPKFINVGDIVKKDQPLLIVEAMKVMNYIKAPKDGRVTHIAVKDAQPIEFGQLLLVIE